MNPSEFMKKWIEGIKNLDYKRQLQVKIAGHIGNIIAFSAGIPTMIYFSVVLKDYKWWWTILVLIIADYMAILELIATRQQLKASVVMENEIMKMQAGGPI